MRAFFDEKNTKEKGRSAKDEQEGKVEERDEHNTRANEQ
jgi:hypothetical protein